MSPPPSAAVARRNQRAEPPVTGVAPAEADGLAERVAFLSDPANYPAPGCAVEPVETHLSWVFLTDTHAWKLKKPVRNEHVDFTTPRARERNARTEVRLNRRLAPAVYLGVKALRRRDDGALTLGVRGTVVDWLVVMKRLPRDRMLDALLARGGVTSRDLEGVIGLLCAFYAKASRARITPAGYLRGFAGNIASIHEDLAARRYGLPPSLVAASRAAQQEALAALAPVLAERAREHRIVEGHGDLRLEHVCVVTPPIVIDCLEFSRVLRRVDPVDEIAFLALECERLGRPDAGAVLLRAYARLAADPAPAALAHFYAAFRAGVRARLAVRHLDDPALQHPRWRANAERYLELGCAHLARIAGDVRLPAAP